MKKDHQKIIIGAIIFFLILGLGNWFYFTKIYSKKTKPEPTLTPETSLITTEPTELPLLQSTATPILTLTPTPTIIYKFKIPSKTLEKMPLSLPTSTPSPTPTIKFSIPSKALQRMFP